MTEDITTPVGVTKNKLWAAYKELKAQRDAAGDSGPATTTAVAQQKKARAAVKAASDVNVTGLSDGVTQLLERIDGAKTTYDELQTAIDTKKQELQEVHGIEVEANTLVLIAETKEQLVERKEAQAAELVTEAQERAAALLQAANEAEKAQAQQRQRTEQEWKYSFARQKRQEEDTFQDALTLRAKAAAEREAALASDVNVTGLSDGVTQLLERIDGAKTTYDELQTAIDTKKQELQEVHGIEVEANTLVLIAETKEQLVERKEAQAAELVTEAQERAAALLQAANEAEKAQAQQRQRTEQEWKYSFARQKRQEEDTFQDALTLRAKAAAEREAAVQEREDQADQKDEEITYLKEEVERLGAQTQEKIDEAVLVAKEGARRSAAIAKGMDDKGHQADTSIKTARISTLEEQVDDLATRLERQQQRVEDANTKLADMARASLQAGADAATVAKISEVAAGGGKK